jgi:hypothetical protein
MSSQEGELLGNTKRPKASECEAWCSATIQLSCRLIACTQFDLVVD